MGEGSAEGLGRRSAVPELYLVLAGHPLPLPLPEPPVSPNLSRDVYGFWVRPDGGWGGAGC